MELRFTYAAEEHRHILYSLIKIRMVNCLNQSFTMVLVLTIFFNTFLKLKQTIYIYKRDNIIAFDSISLLDKT
jgi:hypothetical protein